MAGSDEYAHARIAALIQTAQANARQTGGQPADAIFDLLVAAAALGGANEPVTTVEAGLGKVLPIAAACAADWFPKEAFLRAN